MKNFKNRLLHSINNIFKYHENVEYDFALPESNSNVDEIAIDDATEYKEIFNTLNVNLEYMKIKYNALINSDIKFREFKFFARNKEYKAFLVYIDGMINSESINNFILRPMLSNKSKHSDSIATAISNNITVRKVKKFNLEEYIIESLIPENDIKKFKEFDEIVSEINIGNCALFVDTLNVAFSIDVKGFKHRNVSEPQNEIIVRGSQEGFVEVLRVNTTILRRITNNENLIIEKANVGKLSKTSVAICYIKNIVNDALVSEVKHRINNLDIDYMLSSGQLEQLIQDNGNISFPQIISTERPDKVCNLLYEGRVAIIINGTPYVLVVPGIFVDFISSPEDFNLKYQFSNILRFIRLLALFLTLLLPGLYIAITNYHPELIPTELLFAIAEAREAVPFPVIEEIIVMEISFELIREAAVRVPSPIGPTIGIVGALILGEAAVSASIVSPILIIIVSITAISSFAVPDFSLGFTLRFLRFLFLMLGFVAGFLGIALGLFIYISILNSLKSFGTPYLAPYVPSQDKDINSAFFLKPIWLREKRPAFLSSKKSFSEGKLSMLWKKPQNS